MTDTCLLIATRNRQPQLWRSLDRLRNLTHPDEILIVDDGGTDETRLVTEEFSDLNVRYIYLDQPGVSMCSRARNVGVKNTDCSIIVTADPEVVFVTDVIKQFTKTREKEPEQCISAGTVFYEKQGTRAPIDLAQLNRTAWAFNEYPDADVRVTVGWVATYAVMYERRWLEDIHGWDEEFPDPWGWDDTDIMTRLRLSGHPQTIDPSVAVVHQWHPTDQCDQGPNEAHFKAKGFDNGDLSRLVANPDGWGML